MSHSEAHYFSDAGFYIGQTPQQTKPIRSTVRNVTSWGNPIGFSATNMRYVTITRSRFFNNGMGIVPNALDSEKFPPAEDNVITDNDIFWNNFNFHEGAPFKPKTTGVVPLVPIGTGVLLLGGKRNRVEGNRIFGNYLAGAAAVEGILRREDHQAARALMGNQVTGNQFGLGGEDLNGRDLAYDGNGSGQLLGPERGRAGRCSPTTPRCSPPARSRARTRSASRRAGPDGGLGGAERRRPAGSGTRTRPRPASRRWRSSRSEAPPLAASPRAGRRRARRGAGRRRQGQDRARSSTTTTSRTS